MFRWCFSALAVILIGALPSCSHADGGRIPQPVEDRTLQAADVAALQDEPVWAYGFERPP